MTPDSLDILALSQLFPGVLVRDGGTDAKDSRGTPFEKVGICGVVEDGALMPSLMNGTREQAWYMFLHALRARLGDNKVLVVRTYPTLVEHCYRMEDLYNGDATGHSTRYSVRVQGRFCYYKEPL